MEDIQERGPVLHYNDFVFLRSNNDIDAFTILKNEGLVFYFRILIHFKIINYSLLGRHLYVKKILNIVNL